MFTPAETDNLVFIDTEFSDLDPLKGEILSIGLVKLNGDELYIEIEPEQEPSEWVKKHILPMLDGPKLTKKQTVYQIKEFLGDTNPFAVFFVDNYDLIYLTNLFGVGKLPFRWATVDFASILFSLGINPIKIQSDEKSAMAFYRKLGIKIATYKKHHALDDAKLLRDVWLKTVKQSEA